MWSGCNFKICVNLEVNVDLFYIRLLLYMFKKYIRRIYLENLFTLLRTTK